MEPLQILIPLFRFLKLSHLDVLILNSAQSLHQISFDFPELISLYVI